MARSSTSVPAGGGQVPLAPLIHGRVRLMVLSLITTEQRPVPFTEIRAQLGLTDGSLSVHLSRLAEGGLISLEKRFVGKRPQTLVAVTPEGRRRFAKYVQELRDIVPGL